MISLKMTQDDSPYPTIAGSPDSGPNYGYGTCVNLEEEQVAALGIQDLPIGAKVRIVAFATVTSLRVEPEEGEEGKTPNMSLQLTDMEVSKASNVDAESMYSTTSKTANAETLLG